ncbi:MAG: hypothetical protein EOP86_08000 [Verrucomicrobiaceae bacterium]|nr:MAG: hypothetical protein EOP86_08000 [Verrucomicrobiaceae bacterium]
MKRIIPVWTCLTAAVGLSVVPLWMQASSSSLRAQNALPSPERNATDLAAEVERLKSLLPDQSHAMTDVAHHMTHAWFAGQAKNWPLAKFYIDETRSHIGWAVKIKPVRKGADNTDFPLQPYADAAGNGPLADVLAAIEAQDSEAFSNSYQAALTACYACHVASGKPYLRLRVPRTPENGVIDFSPPASH